MNIPDMNNHMNAPSAVCFNTESIGSHSSLNSISTELLSLCETGIPDHEAVHEPTFHPEDEYFEGPEKTLEVWFDLLPSSPSCGLRTLSQDVLDDICAKCNCEIISHKATVAMDAYVLSESSLFVSPSHFVMKTCGRTTLLCSLPPLLEHVFHHSALNMRLAGVKFSRRSYTRPQEQLFPHRSFEEEQAFFAQTLAAYASEAPSLPSSPQVLQLGSPSASQWYVLSSVASEAKEACYGALTVMMDGMSSTSLPAFYHTLNLSTHGLREHQRHVDGLLTESQQHEDDVEKRPYLAPLTPSQHVQDFFLFAPCGFSMNTLLEQENEEENNHEQDDEDMKENENDDVYSSGTDSDGEDADDVLYPLASSSLEQFSSAHITPQHAFSYASWEMSGSSMPSLPSLVHMLQDLVTHFQPRHLTLTFTPAFCYSSTQTDEQQLNKQPTIVEEYDNDMEAMVHAIKEGSQCNYEVLYQEKEVVWQRKNQGKSVYFCTFQQED